MTMWSGIFLASLLFVGAESGHSSRPDVIELPVGFFPEGITLGNGWTAYVGSLAYGSIWKGNLRTGRGEVVISDVNAQAGGLDHDRRSGFLFVAGGSAARVYGDDNSLVAEFVFAGENEASLLNDVYVTKTAAYFTDSFQDKLFKIPLDAKSGELLDLVVTAANTITLSEEFGVVEGEINANGIVASDDGGSILIAANSNSGKIFTVDPETGTATPIDLGGVLVYGDGLVLRNNTLWVVDNGVNVGGLQQVIEISLSPDLTCGSVVPRALTSVLFDTPSTAARKGNSLYVVNAKFGVAEEDRSTTEYEIVRVDRDSGELVCTSV